MLHPLLLKLVSAPASSKASVDNSAQLCCILSNPETAKLWPLDFMALRISCPISCPIRDRAQASATDRPKLHVSTRMQSRRPRQRHCRPAGFDPRWVNQSTPSQGFRTAPVDLCRSLELAGVDTTRLPHGSGRAGSCCRGQPNSIAQTDGGNPPALQFHSP